MLKKYALSKIVLCIRGNTGRENGGQGGPSLKLRLAVSTCSALEAKPSHTESGNGNVVLAAFPVQ